jgi:hypothetical protein
VEQYFAFTPPQGGGIRQRALSGVQPFDGDLARTAQIPASFGAAPRLAFPGWRLFYVAVSEGALLPSRSATNLGDL